METVTIPTITIPKEEYEFLLKCKHVIESDFEEKFSEQFIREIKESEKAYAESLCRRGFCES